MVGGNTDQDKHVALHLISTSTRTSNREVGFAGDGGLARNAQLHWVSRMAADESGSVYIADRGNYRVRVLIPLYGALQPQE